MTKYIYHYQESDNLVFNYYKLFTTAVTQY